MGNYQLSFSCFLHTLVTPNPVANKASTAKTVRAKEKTLFGRFAQHIRKPAMRVNRNPAKPHIPR